jgi:hypothetical protein
MRPIVYLCLSLAFLFNVSVAAAQTTRYQNGYYRSNGTYVRPHYKTVPNRTNRDNYSTQGNRNGYTGTYGSRARDYSAQSYNYGRGRTIYTGPRGGQYYYNSRGNKVYVPKR